MSETTNLGAVSEEDIKEIIAIQDAISPSALGVSIEDTITAMDKYILPQYKGNLFGVINDYNWGREGILAGNLKWHTSTRHDMIFYSGGDTIICYGLADGADYNENGEIIRQHPSFPFCDVFVRVDGELRLLAVMASAVQEGATVTPDK